MSEWWRFAGGDQRIYFSPHYTEDTQCKQRPCADCFELVHACISACVCSLGAEKTVCGCMLMSPVLSNIICVKVPSSLRSLAVLLIM